MERGCRLAVLGLFVVHLARADSPDLAPPPAAPAATPPLAGPAPAARVTSRETTLAVVASEDVTAVSFVASHVDALGVYLRSSANLGPAPGRKPRIEAADIAGLPDVHCAVSGGHVLVAVRLGSPADAPLRSGEAAARAWLAAASVAGAQPTATPAAWAPPSLAAEVVAQLRPAMVDLWYRRAAAHPPSTLAEVVAGRAPVHESLLLGRALRRALGPERFAYALVAAARGEPLESALAEIDREPSAWWPAARQSLLDARPSPSLGISESLAELDALARFVHDPVGQGDILLTGPQAARLRMLPALKVAMAERLARLRLGILRQNPVAHNAWRSLGAWLEAYPSATEEQLDRLWVGYENDRAAASRLAAEVEQALGEAR